jgi:hypothetical protein
MPERGRPQQLANTPFLSNISTGLVAAGTPLHEIIPLNPNFEAAASWLIRDFWMSPWDGDRIFPVEPYSNGVFIRETLRGSAMSTVSPTIFLSADCGGSLLMITIRKAIIVALVTNSFSQDAP